MFYSFPLIISPLSWFENDFVSKGAATFHFSEFQLSVGVLKFKFFKTKTAFHVKQATCVVVYMFICLKTGLE